MTKNAKSGSEEHGAIECGNVFSVADDHPLPGYLPPEDIGSDTPRVFYARAGHPAVWALESTLAALEGAETAVCAASGMSVISQTMFALLSAGDTLLYSRWAYPNTVDFFEQHLARLGVRVVATDSSDPICVARDMEACRPKVFFFEPLGNPSLTFSNPADIAQLCTASGAVQILRGAVGILGGAAAVQHLDQRLEPVAALLTAAYFCFFFWVFGIFCCC